MRNPLDAVVVFPKKSKWIIFVTLALSEGEKTLKLITIHCGKNNAFIESDKKRVVQIELIIAIVLYKMLNVRSLITDFYLII